MLKTWQYNQKKTEQVVFVWKGCQQKGCFLQEHSNMTLGLQSCIRTNHKASGTVSSEQMRPKWNIWPCIVTHLSKTKHSTSARRAHTNCSVGNGGNLGLFCSPGYLAVIELTMNSSVYENILYNKFSITGLVLQNAFKNHSATVD